MNTRIYPILNCLGGEGGIRTLDTLADIALFESARFNHSRTSPDVVTFFADYFVKTKPRNTKINKMNKLAPV